MSVSVLGKGVGGTFDMGPMAQFCCCDKRKQHAGLEKKISCSVTGKFL